MRRHSMYLLLTMHVLARYYICPHRGGGSVGVTCFQCSSSEGDQFRKSSLPHLPVLPACAGGPRLRGVFHYVVRGTVDLVPPRVLPACAGSPRVRGTHPNSLFPHTWLLISTRCTQRLSHFNSSSSYMTLTHKLCYTIYYTSRRRLATSDSLYTIPYKYTLTTLHEVLVGTYVHLPPCWIGHQVA